MVKCITGNYIAFEFPLISEKDFEKTESGIKKKIFRQYKALENYGFKMRFYNPYLERDILTWRIRRRLPLFHLLKWDEEEKYISGVDFEYIRKPWHMDGDLIHHLKKVKVVNPKCKIILEIPTFPYDNEHHTLSMKPLILKDKLWRKQLSYYVDRIATYSDDKEIFGIQTINISNAFDVESTQIANYKSYNPEELHVMMCATLAYWHGYDRAILGLIEYYKKGGTANIVLHIVGNGEETEHFNEMIKKYHLEDHVVMYGAKYGPELDEIYGKCDVGFDSMGRHRSGVYYNSSLKGKEYAAKGLPIVSGVRTELDTDKSFLFYHRVPADETPIDYFDIVNFCNKVYQGKTVQNVRESIRQYARENYSYAATFHPIAEYILANS